MTAAKSSDNTDGPGRSPGEARRAVRHDVVFRATTHPDGTITGRFSIPDVIAPRDRSGFLEWRATHVPPGLETALVSVLVIREVIDRHGAILACELERRRGSTDGPFQGNPARVTFVGAAQQARFYQATPDGDLREIIPPLDARGAPVARQDHFVGEEATIRAAFGEAAHILDARSPTVIEEMVGMTSILHVRTPADVEIDCGLGWHGTAPFLLQAEFPRFGAVPPLPAAEQAAIEVAAVAARLVTYEIRADGRGAAVVARSSRDGTCHLLRPTTSGICVEAYTPGVPAGLLTDDQATWLRYATTHEYLVVLDVFVDGRSDNVFVLTGTPNGCVLRHLIDADGVEVWRAAADDTAVAVIHRETDPSARRL